MTGALLQTTQLRAPWNPGGTYLSAFEILEPDSLTLSPETNEHVYIGEIESIFKGRTGYLLTLTVRHASGHDLRVWIQNIVATSQAGGEQLWKRLQQGTIVPGNLVFALGKFTRQTTSAAATFYSMPIVDARRVWIVDSTQLEALSPETSVAP